MTTIIYILLIILMINTLFFGIWSVYISIKAKKVDTFLNKDHIRGFSNLYIFIPTLNEFNSIEHSLKKTIKTLKNISIQSKIIVIDDDSNDGTSEILHHLENKYPEYLKVLYRKLPNAQQGKGKSLNFALKYLASINISKNSIIGIIDSDSYPTIELLNRVLFAFEHSSYDLIQTGIKIENNNSYLPLMQDYEFKFINALSQITRTEHGSAIASGNGQFMTYSMLQHVHWGNSLLDDLEFSLDGLLKGFKGLYLSDQLLAQEGITSYGALIKQRVRWCQGGMQCLNRYFFKLLKLKKMKIVTDILLFLILPYFSIAAVFASVTSIVVFTILLTHHFLRTFIILITIFLISVLASLTLILSIKSNVPNLKLDWHKIPIMIVGNLFYIWLIAPTVFIAIYRVMTSRNDWVKTEHNTQKKT